MFDKRWRLSGVTLLSALALTALALGACGGTSTEGSETPDPATASPSSPPEQTVANSSPQSDETPVHSHDEDEGDSYSATYDELRQTEEYKPAFARFEECMASAGFTDLYNPEGILLADGTRWKIEGGAIVGTLASFLANTQRCEIESGVQAIEEQHGHGDEWVASPAETAQQNQRQVAIMACVEARGWEIPEPLLLPGPGLLVFDIRIPPEEQAAYDLDYAECVEEQGGF